MNSTQNEFVLKCDFPWNWNDFWDECECAMCVRMSTLTNTMHSVCNDLNAFIAFVYMHSTWINKRNNWLRIFDSHSAYVLQISKDICLCKRRKVLKSMNDIRYIRTMFCVFKFLEAIKWIHKFDNLKFVRRRLGVREHGMVRRWS